MEQGAALPGNRGQLRDGLHGADLVVGVHDRHKGGVVGHRRPQGVRRHDAGLVDGQEGRLPPPPGQGFEGVEDCLVLDCAGDEVLSAGRIERLRNAADGEIVALSPPAREDHVARIRAN